MGYDADERRPNEMKGPQQQPLHLVEYEFVCAIFERFQKIF